VNLDKASFIEGSPEEVAGRRLDAEDGLGSGSSEIDDPVG